MVLISVSVFATNFDSGMDLIMYIVVQLIFGIAICNFFKKIFMSSYEIERRLILKYKNSGKTFLEFIDYELSAL